MKEFAIHSIYVKDVLNELAKEFQTELEERLTEYRLSFPEELGEGYIQGLNFPNGIGLFRFKGKFKQQTTFNFKSTQVHPLKFIYCTEGSFNHGIKPDKKPRKIQKYQSAIVSSYYDFGHIYTFPADEEFSIQVVEVDRKRFSTHIDYKLEDIPYHFYRIFADIEGVNKNFL